MLIFDFHYIKEIITPPSAMMEISNRNTKHMPLLFALLLSWSLANRIIEFCVFLPIKDTFMLDLVELDLGQNPNGYTQGFPFFE